jgi:DnaJ-domain-containing protein 1
MAAIVPLSDAAPRDRQRFVADRSSSARLASKWRNDRLTVASHICGRDKAAGAMKDGTRAISSVAVEISLFDGTSLFGKLAVPIQGRVSDLLNDQREFVPVECADGRFVAVSKRAIKHVSLPGPTPQIYQGDDPYRILGVAEGISPEELKRSYYHLCAKHHPDHIRGLGLGVEYEQLATQQMTRINSAYSRIVKRMKES